MTEIVLNFRSFRRGMTSVPCSVDSSYDHFWLDSLQVVSPSDPGEQVYQGGGKVRSVPRELRCLVVPGEGVVVVVPALTESDDSHVDVLHRRDESSRTDKYLYTYEPTIY